MAAGRIASTPEPLANPVLDFLAKDHYTAYPMLDHRTQPSVVSAASMELDAALGGDITPLAALRSMQQTLLQLPAAQRSSTYQ